MEGAEWHRVRGAQMVVAMKVISVAFDLDSGQIPRLPGPWHFAGYLLHPGTVIFGPWVSYQEYANVEFHAKKKMVCMLQYKACY